MTESRRWAARNKKRRKAREKGDRDSVSLRGQDERKIGHEGRKPGLEFERSSG